MPNTLPKALALAAAALALVGCALTPVEGPPIGGLMPSSSNNAGRRPDSSAQVPTPGAVTPRIVPADSTPSADAREVLATIPDPLPPGERVPPPPDRSADTLAAPADANVPVPEPTPVLNQPPPPPIEVVPPASGAPPAAPARPDTCWRLQVGAPETAEEAEQRRSAAESLLMSAFVVQAESGLFKVRTRECVSRSAALALRDRALGAGFAGAFPIAIVRQ